MLHGSKVLFDCEILHVVIEIRVSPDQCHSTRIHGAALSSVNPLNH